VIFLFLGRLALTSHRRPPVTGKEGLIGMEGTARHAIAPDSPGYVHVHGELWRATSRVPVTSGQRVRVLDVNGLTLMVDPVVGATREGASS
jgi:membrane-bound serine protease (ClpP class)